MSVRLLAGPFPVKTISGKPLIYTLGQYTWYPNVGMLLSGTTKSSESQSTYLVLLDGVASEEPIKWFRGTWSWWPARKNLVYLSATRLIDGSIENIEYKIEPVALMIQSVGPQVGWETGSSPVENNRYVKLENPDRRIYPDGGFYIARQVDGVAADVREGGPFLVQIGQLLPGRSDHDVWAMGTRSTDAGKGRGFFYDTVTCKRASPYYVIQQFPYFDHLTYCPEYGVLLSVHKSGPDSVKDPLMFRVWSLEVEPTTLTDPVPFIGTPKSGQVVTYRVRVTGDDDDGAEGELVDWSLTGAGFLLDVQTKADVDGYATARVQYGLRETGQSVVTARVVC